MNPKSRLVERVTFYRRTGGEWKQMELRQYLEYNQPIDPKNFQPDMPNDVMVVNQIDRKPGLEKGNLTEDEIAKKVGARVLRVR